MFCQWPRTTTLSNYCLNSETLNQNNFPFFYIVYLGSLVISMESWLTAGTIGLLCTYLRSMVRNVPKVTAQPPRAAMSALQAFPGTSQGPLSTLRRGPSCITVNRKVQSSSKSCILVGSGDALSPAQLTSQYRDLPLPGFLVGLLRDILSPVPPLGGAMNPVSLSCSPAKKASKPLLHLQREAVKSHIHSAACPLETSSGKEPLHLLP